MTTTDVSTPPPEAQPVTFDRDGRRLFGWYHAPAVRDGLGRDTVVVLCNPIGYDAVCTHRHYRILAQQLAASGFAVLRYDHHGTGDSSGSEEDPERIPAWTNGVARAVEFASLTSGARQVALCGVRMGGTLALSAAAGAVAADSLVAWAPFASGNAYLREMRALRMLKGAHEPGAATVHDEGADLGEEAAGYVLTSSTIAALGELNLLTIDKPPAPALLLLSRDDLPGNDRLARHLTGLGCEVTQSATPGYAGMMRDTYVATVPQEALAEIRQWLEARHPLCPVAEPQALPPPDSILAGMSGANAGVAETATRFGDGGRLFGVVSAPVQPHGGRDRTGIIFVSVGSNLHTGPNRMYVTQARVLASLGFTALRMDIGGVGESHPAPGKAENTVYAMYSVADVLAAIAHLRSAYGVERFVLVGVCSGAYLSFHAAMADMGVASIVLVNPQTFTWREGDTLDLRSRKGVKSIRFYRSKLLDANTWKRLVTGQVNVGTIGAGVAQKVRKRAAARLAGLGRAATSGPEIKPMRFYGSHLLHGGTWKRLFAGDIDLRIIAFGMAGKLSRRIAAGLGWLRRGGAPATDAAAEAVARSTDLRGILRGFLGRGMDVFMVFSSNDGGLDEIETHLGPNASKLRKEPRFKFQLVEGADHTFTPLWSQRRLSDLLAQHVMRLYG